MAASYSTRPGVKPSLTVINAIATHVGADPTDLRPPVGDFVDLEALDALFERTKPATVTFDYDGFLVEAHCDDRISVAVDGGER